LDHKTGGEIILLMRDLAKKENRAVLVVTHDPEVARMADKILLLRDGVLVEELVTAFFRPSGVDVETRRPEDSRGGGDISAEG
jgi:putative ABC transport system ATP-binding protein